MIPVTFIMSKRGAYLLAKIRHLSFRILLCSDLPCVCPWQKLYDFDVIFEGARRQLHFIFLLEAQRY